MSEHPSTQKMLYKEDATTVKFAASFAYNMKQRLTILLHLLKSFKLLKSLRGANEGNSGIENIRVGVKGEIFGAI